MPDKKALYVALCSMTAAFSTSSMQKSQLVASVLPAYVSATLLDGCYTKKSALSSQYLRTKNHINTAPKRAIYNVIACKAFCNSARHPQPNYQPVKQAESCYLQLLMHVHKQHRGTHVTRLILLPVMKHLFEQIQIAVTSRKIVRFF